MAVIETGTTATQVAVEGKAQRAMIVGRGNAYAISNATGTIGAALAANSSVFAMRLSPSSTLRAYIDRIRVQYTTIVAYTTPVTANRRLALFRGSGAAASGGTATLSVAKDTAAFPVSQCMTANGGDARIATTAALTVTGITFESDPLRTMSLVHVGNAGNYAEALWESHAGESYPIVLNPGQVLAIRNPAAMDAAGTWQMAVNVDWHEAAAL
jgi:hypothetical protein